MQFSAHLFSFGSQSPHLSMWWWCDWHFWYWQAAVWPWLVNAMGTGTGTRLPTCQKPTPVPVPIIVMSHDTTKWAMHTSFVSHFHPTSTTTKVKLIFSLLSRYVQLQIQRKVSKYYYINITDLVEWAIAVHGMYESHWVWSIYFNAT